jgi:DTW domain-containing protein YfiP
MHRSLCVCGLVPRLETRTRLVLVLHRAEERKTTNTGRLAAACLVNSEIIVRGHASQPTEPIPVAPGSQPLLLFPAADARPLADLPPRLVGAERPVTLIVPDGTWRQAFKVRSRVPGLRDVPCVTLPAGAPSSYRLRSEAHAHGLSTLEAIARVLGVIEGPLVQEALERLFRAMVERTLWARGAIEARDVTDGIPEGVRRDDPESGLGEASGALRQPTSST